MKNICHEVYFLHKYQTLPNNQKTSNFRLLLSMTILDVVSRFVTDINPCSLCLSIHFTIFSSRLFAAVLCFSCLRFALGVLDSLSSLLITRPKDISRLFASDIFFIEPVFLKTYVWYNFCAFYYRHLLNRFHSCFGYFYL